MISNESRAIAEEAKKLYESGLRDALERNSFGKYVSIEPQSGDHFVGETFDDAVNAAIDKYPSRLTHTIRVGHRAAFHLGVLEQ
ncbi:MAG: hypothetical protein R3E01_10870 [Pirellulaceae bacterium]